MLLTTFAATASRSTTSAKKEGPSCKSLQDRIERPTRAAWLQRLECQDCLMDVGGAFCRGPNVIRRPRPPLPPLLQLPPTEGLSHGATSAEIFTFASRKAVPASLSLASMVCRSFSLASAANLPVGERQRERITMHLQDGSSLTGGSRCGQSASPFVTRIKSAPLKKKAHNPPTRTLTSRYLSHRGYAHTACRHTACRHTAYRHTPSSKPSAKRSQGFHQENSIKRERRSNNKEQSRRSQSSLSVHADSGRR